MSETGVVKGFKVFNPDWTCNPNGKPFQYELGGIYEEDVKPMVCDRGFHFCEKAADCFNYYQFNPENKVAEAETTGGYLKVLDNSECAVIWWRGLSDRQKNIIAAIPNFDKAIFKEITGIDVDED